MKKDKYYHINKSKKKGNGIIVFIAIVAICITGILYALKLNSESRYLYMETNALSVVEQQ